MELSLPPVERFGALFEWFWTRALEEESVWRLLVGEGRARVWRLYMAGSAVGFEDGGISLHQVLGVLPSDDGTTGLSPVRDDWTPPGAPDRTS